MQLLHIVISPEASHFQKAPSDHIAGVIINFELWAYSRFYKRKDQDLAEYAAYLSSEDELEKKYSN